MTIRARSYTNRKDVVRIQITMDLDEAKEFARIKGDSAVGELGEALRKLPALKPKKK